MISSLKCPSQFQVAVRPTQLFLKVSTCRVSSVARKSKSSRNSGYSQLVCFAKKMNQSPKTVATSQVDPQSQSLQAPTSGGYPMFSGVSIALIALQVVALVGATVGGILAKNRKLELQQMNDKLRQINTEMRRQRQDIEAQELKRSEEEERRKMEEDEEESAAQQQQQQLEERKATMEQLEQSMAAPSAAHPVESYGSDGGSLAQTSMQMINAFKQGKEALDGKLFEEALQHLDDAEQRAIDVASKQHERFALRNKAYAHRMLGDYKSALENLERVLSLSNELKEFSTNVDVYGEMADIYVDMGDLATAGDFYDKCIEEIPE